MKNKILIGSALFTLIAAGTLFAASTGSVSQGYGYGKAAACASATSKAKRMGVTTSKCYCDAPKYDGGQWACYVDYVYKK